MTNWYLTISDLIFLSCISAGGVLLYHLGAGSTPGNLKPLASVWVRLGGTPESFKVVLWVLFVLLALSLLIIIGYPLYLAITDLGRPWK
jgi:hypothetical protein